VIRKERIDVLNSVNKKPPRTQGISQPFNSQERRAPQNAPPVFRPQPVPKVLQKKSAPVQPPHTVQSPHRPVAPPVYRPEAKKMVQPKVVSTQPGPLNPPPVYRPQPIPKVLQTKKAGSKQNEHKPPAASAGRIRQSARVAQPKANHGHRNTLQLHPLAIKIEGYQEWKRDTGAIDLPTDINLFHARIRPDNPEIMSIKVKRKSTGDHQVVVVGMAGGLFMQMDISSYGTMLRYPADDSHYPITVGTFRPRDDLKLDDVFRAFFNLTHQRGFDFEDYNCIRFANNLAGSIGNAIEDDSGGSEEGEEGAAAAWDMGAFV
jgi:hypothetical protein